MAKPSTRVRLIAAAVLVAIVVLGIGAGLIRAAVATRADDQAVAYARSKLAVIGTVFVRSHEDPTAVAEAVGANTTWAVDLGAGKYVTGGIWTRYLAVGQTLPLPAPRAGPQLLTHHFEPLPTCIQLECELAGPQLRSVAQTISVGNAEVHAYVLVWPFAAAEALSTVDPVLLVSMPVGVLLVGLLTWWVVGRVLRPVERMRAQLVDITANDLSRRVPVPRTGDELQRWAITTNETLDRLEAAVGRHRRFVDDAAHELRSPLASLLSTLEVAATHPDCTDLPAAVGTALAEARRLQRLTDDLLLLARLDRTTPVHSRVVDLDAVVAEQVAERRFAGPGPRYVLSTVDVRVVGDEAQLGRVLRNLLDNAARFARDEVRVGLSRTGGTVELEVHDDGPGIPVVSRTRVFDRFARLDQARDQHHGGTGLGLAIVRDIVRGHGGSIEIADSRAGARVVVRLPACRAMDVAADPIVDRMDTSVGS